MDDIFATCSTPRTAKEHKEGKNSGMAITICDTDQLQDDDASPCISVVSRTSIPDCNDSRHDTCRELDGLFATETSLENEKDTPAAQPVEKKRPVLRTGATGWGDEDSSDEEDDDLL